MIDVLHISDPGCPWAYSAAPAHTALRWRYGDALRWRHVMIGLADDGAEYERRGYTPARRALGNLAFRTRGMPFSTEPPARIPATGLACRAVIATRLLAPEREWEVFRTLQRAWFTTPALLDEPDALTEALTGALGSRGRSELQEERGEVARDRALVSPAEIDGQLDSLGAHHLDRALSGCRPGFARAAAALGRAAHGSRPDAARGLSPRRRARGQPRRPEPRGVCGGGGPGAAAGPGSSAVVAASPVGRPPAPLAASTVHC